MGFESPNYTMIPNEFFEMLPHLKEAESKCLLVVMRETFGYHKIGQKLAVSVLMEKTGLSNSAVIDATLALCDAGILRRKIVGGMYYYEVVISDEMEEQMTGEKSSPQKNQTGENSSHIKRNVNLNKRTSPSELEFKTPSELHLLVRLQSQYQSKGRTFSGKWSNVTQRDLYRALEVDRGKRWLCSATDTALAKGVVALDKLVNFVVSMDKNHPKEPERKYREEY